MARGGVRWRDTGGGTLGGGGETVTLFGFVAFSVITAVIPYAILYFVTHFRE